MDGDNTSATVQPSPPSWTSLTLDDLAAIALTQGQEPAEGEEGRATDTAASMSEEERKRRRPLRQRGESSFTSPFALCHHNSVPAAAKQGSGSGVNVDEVVISSVIGYALVRLEAHKDKITASTLEKPLSAADLLELNELQEVLSAELKTSGRVPSITMRKDARATMSYSASNSLASSSSSTRNSVRSAPQSTNAFALDPAKLTACEPQVLLSLIREYCRVHIRLFPMATQRGLAACLDIKCTSFRLNAIHSLVHFLPSGNKTMLQYLLSFLHNLLKNADKNGIAIDSLAIIFGPCLLRSRPEDPDREVALGVSILREMIEHYERLFVELKDMIWKATTDGGSHLAIARVEQIVETAIDPNYLEEPFVDILFLTHDYYIKSTQLLNHFVDLYDRYSSGKEEWMTDIRIRTLETVDYWVHCFPSCFDSVHTFLQRLEEFVVQLSKEIKHSTHTEEWPILVSLTECAKEKRRQAGLSEQEKSEEDEEKKGGINWLRKRRGSQLGNHRLSLNPQGKISSALRAIRKSGASESKKDPTAEGGGGKAKREASPKAGRKNKKEQGSPLVGRSNSTEDSPPREIGGKQDVREEASKKKAQSADKASVRSERRLSRRATRADLNSTSLASSLSTTHIQDRDPKKEATKERRGSFMIRTLSGSFMVPHRSLKEESEEQRHNAGGTREDRKSSISLASGQSWAGVVPVHSAKEDIDFLTADPGHVARQLTLMDWELFKSVDCEELLKGRFMQPQESPSFTAMVKRFNLTGQWVCWMLLKYETAAERAKAIEQYIKICVECRKLHNYNSFFAIVGGLNTTAISRLKGSWEKVPKKFARMYKEIMELASTDGNFWNYRSVLKKTPLPLIPYLAICTQDLFKVEEKQTFVSGGMIYFDKMRLLWQFHSSFRKWQSTHYNFVVDRGMRAFINDFVPFSEKEMYDRSYEVEPRSGSHVGRG